MNRKRICLGSVERVKVSWLTCQTLVPIETNKDKNGSDTHIFDVRSSYRSVAIHHSRPVGCSIYHTVVDITVLFKAKDSSKQP